MRSRTAASAASRTRVITLGVLVGVLVMTSQAPAGASVLADTDVATDGGMTLDLAGPVGIGAVALGVLGLVLGFLRQRRRTTERAVVSAPDEDAYADTVTTVTMSAVRPVQTGATAPRASTAVWSNQPVAIPTVVTTRPRQRRAPTTARPARR
ncbi:MAG: hypothetical protein ACRDQ5_06720 [Sciscionella sp.]